MRFSQARLLVDDFQTAIRFYRDTLGLSNAFGDESSGYASFDTGSGGVAIFERGGQGEVVELRRPATRPCSFSRSTTSTPTWRGSRPTWCASLSTSPSGAGASRICATPPGT